MIPEHGDAVQSLAMDQYMLYSQAMRVYPPSHKDDHSVKQHNKYVLRFAAIQADPMNSTHHSIFNLKPQPLHASHTQNFSYHMSTPHISYQSTRADEHHPSLPINNQLNHPRASIQSQIPLFLILFFSSISFSQSYFLLFLSSCTILYCW